MAIEPAIKIRKYWRIWRQLSAMAIASYLSNRLDIASYTLGKLARFGFFLAMILAIFKHTDLMAGYMRYEVVLFYLIFNLADILPQAFFRGIYLFKDDIRLGTFDHVLAKPVNPLFYSLTRLTDIIDIATLFPLAALIAYVIGKLDITLGWQNFSAFILLFLFGQLIILAFHILSACLTLIYIESDSVIWLYRYVLTFGRFPPEVFPPFLQGFFTFILPVFVVIAFPVKSLIGILGPTGLVLAPTISLAIFILSIYFWRSAIWRYQSASS